MATVIRVKRKRHAEPAGALLLASKKMKHNENFSGKSGMADIIQIEENVFRFATTVNMNTKMDDTVKNKVKDAIVLHSKINSLYKTQPLVTHNSSVVGMPTGQVSIEERPKYKLLGLSSRNPGFENIPPKSQQEQNANPVKPNLPPSKQILKEEKKACNYFTPILDVEEQETKKCNSSNKPEDILCNSVKMLREKLCFSEPKPDEDEFVYDLYYCQGTHRSWSVKDILYVQPCRDMNLCFEQHKHKSAYHEEDEDSNDEDHYKNDYPDEEDEEDSIDEDERRLFFDEEEDARCDSDDCDLAPRDDCDDHFGGFFNCNDDAIDQCANDDMDDLDYGDDLNYDIGADFDDFDQNDFGGDMNGDGDYF